MGGKAAQFHAKSKLYFRLKPADLSILLSLREKLFAMYVISCCCCVFQFVLSTSAKLKFSASVQDLALYLVQ